MTDRRVHGKAAAPKPVEIEWRDSIGAGGWHTPDEVATFLADARSTCYTVGYVVRSDRRAIVVAQSLHNENRGALMEIPRRMITKVRAL